MLLDQVSQPRPRFWRDYAGHGADLVAGGETRLVPIEVKSGTTVAADFFRNLVFDVVVSA